MRRITRQHRKPRTLALLLLILSAVILLFGLLYALGSWFEKAEGKRQISETILPSVKDKNRHFLDYKGNHYVKKKNLTSILFIGVDKDNDSEILKDDYRSGGQADYLTLLVVDDNTKTIQRINIDRDTVTEIIVLSALGKPKGTREAQISLSHAYGNNPVQGAELTVEAAKNLLQGVEIDEYVSITMDAIPVMNELVGGVAVSIEEDMTAIDPAFVKGQLVILRGDQAERYVRARKGVSDSTNATRMQRQNVFVSSFFNSIHEKIQNEKEKFINKLLDTLNTYLISSMKVGRLSNLLYRTRGYTIQQPFVFEGEREVNQTNNTVFYPDEDSVMKVILNIFYERVPAKQ